MKIFVSYKRRDASDFARQIYDHLKDKHDIFIDVNIQAGDIWSNTIENNVSTCDIFIIIATYGALESQEVEKEVLQAQRENKTIIPCIHRDVEKNDIKWDLNRFQGFEFDDKYDLARSLYARVMRLQKTRLKEVTRKTSSQKPKKFEMDIEGKDVFIAKSRSKKSENDLQDQHILDLREAALTKLKENQQKKIINDFHYVLRSLKYNNEAKNSTEFSDKLWRILIKDLNRQRFIPFIGPAACFFQGQNEGIRFPIMDILQKWIEHFKYPIEEESYTSWKNIKESGYPLDPSNSLSNVAQSISIKHDDPMYPKRLLAEEIAKITSPDFTDKYNKTVYSFLADLNLPVYVTTNYDHFMETALKSRGKQPISGFCKWNKELVRNSQFDKSRDYQPTTSSPLVYHLFGHLDIPESLVLTKTDFNEFAYFLNKEEERRIFPNTLLIKLATSLLLFIGYNFEHMHFHILYESMIERFDFIMQSDRAIVQPLPLFTNTELNNQLQYLNEIAKKKYKANVYWGNVFDFENDLHECNEKFKNKD